MNDTEKSPRLTGKKIRGFAKLLSALSLLALLAGPAQAAPASTYSLPVQTTRQMQDVLKNGLAWMINAQVANGHFHYEYAPYWNRYTLDDNMVRQTGAFYFL